MQTRDRAEEALGSHKKASVFSCSLQINEKQKLVSVISPPIFFAHRSASRRVASDRPQRQQQSDGEKIWGEAYALRHLYECGAYALTADFSPPNYSAQMHFCVAKFLAAKWTPAHISTRRKSKQTDILAKYYRYFQYTTFASIFQMYDVRLEPVVHRSYWFICRKLYSLSRR